MSRGFEEAQQNLNDLISFYNSEISEDNRNEATTRLQLINRILFECLGWDRKDCKAEDQLDGTYTDYSFYCPECLLIVEAKREGIYFELPVGLKNVKYDIQYFAKHASEVYEAIQQAISYCNSHGTPYGAVCNGHQLIAFMGSRIDGLPPHEGKALVFNSLERINEHFLLTWNCLSREGILSRRLSIELQEMELAPVPEKLSGTISNYPGYKSRNSLQTDLQILSEVLIEGIDRSFMSEEEHRFLEECYCASGALSQYAMISKEILRNRYSATYTKVTEGPTTTPVTTKKGLNPELLAESLSRRPILLIGDVGVGKTMFIRHLCEVNAKDIFEDAIVIYIDFGSKPTFEDEMLTFIQNEIEDQLMNKYSIDIEERNFVHAILHGDLKKFEKGIYGDLRESAPDEYEKKQIEYIEEKLQNKDEYICKVLNHLSKGQQKQIVAFLDNVDQRPYSFQERAFLAGQTMAENWPITLFISIRPETFYRSRVTGTLSAYHPRAFTISPPRIDEVIAKRLDYGVDMLKRGIGLAQISITVQSSTLADYLKILALSFRTNRYLIEFLDNMCGGNVRLALDFVKVFIGSGHVDTNKILSIYNDSGYYLVPLHEFLRAVTYVDYEHYSPQASVILNLFDISTNEGKEHFLSPILLSQMERWAQNSDADGYVHVAEIYAYLQTLGYIPNQINWSIGRLLYKNLLETAAKQKVADNKMNYSELDKPSYYRITTVGAYYVKRLVARFTYLDAIIVDTPILDSDFRNNIYDVSSIRERLARAQLFSNYLDSQWKLLPEADLVFQWPIVKKRIARNIDYVTGKISLREDQIDE